MMVNNVFENEVVGLWCMFTCVHVSGLPKKNSWQSANR